jgi:spore coat polysaccharide biosynthesis protein SpsF
MRVVAIIQARMNSSRLPGKVLLPLMGKPVLEHLVNRLKFSKSLDDIIVATSIERHDDAIAKWATSKGVNLFRGSLSDVLDRYYHAATLYKADAVVRITADCPVIDPFIVDEVVNGFLEGGYDAYGLSGEFPDGLDCQLFSFSAIEKAWKGATLPSEREHVGPYIEKTHPELFRQGGLEKFKGLGHLRWTLDEQKDYELLSEIYKELYVSGRLFTTNDILALLEKRPELLEFNNKIIRNEGYIKSLNLETN